MSAAWRIACALGIALLALGSWTGTEAAAYHASNAPRSVLWIEAPLQQVPNLLQTIVEAVQRALRELQDSLREELCGRCPAVGALVVGSILGAGWARKRRG